MSDQPNNYDQLAERYEAAYAAYRRTYVVRTPPPVKPKSRRENLFTILMLCVLVGASVIVSGNRTVAEFGEVGIPAFVMLELGMITYAFIRTSRNYDKSRHESVTKWVNGGLGLAFVVLLFANADALLKREGIPIPPEVKLIIDMAVAVSAPMLAFISGDVLGMYAVMGRQAQRRIDEEYEAALTLWNESLKASWDREKARWGVRVDLSERQTDRQTALPVSVPVLSEQTKTQTDDRQTSRAGFGHNRTSDGQQKALDYFNAHPDEISTPLRALADKIGVNKDTVSAARKTWQSGREAESQSAVNHALPEAAVEYIASTNGTGEHS